MNKRLTAVGISSPDPSSAIEETLSPSGRSSVKHNKRLTAAGISSPEQSTERGLSQKAQIPTHHRIKTKRETLIILTVFLLALVAAFLLSRYAVRLGVVSGQSMEDTLFEGDLVLISKLSGEVQKGDVIVFYKPDLTRGSIVKRVVAAEGDRVEISSLGELSVNSEYILTFDRDSGFDEMDILLGEGEYFVLGDNNQASTDSRSKEFGLVSKDELEGKVILRLFPKITRIQ